jgi:photosystem II stability/assembly factor-like uncharacterized protein
MKTSRRILLTLSIVLIAPLLFGEEAEDTDEGPLNGLEYRLIGPSVGGRVARVAGVAGDDLTYYAATAAGGVWKSVNGGSQWTSIFDKQPVSSIGSIAVAPSDPNVVWVGSGEANIRGNVAEGNGIYRSTDAGETWERVWTAESQIGTIVVHPTNPDVAFAAVLGSPFGPGPDRGIFRTQDGGKTWTRISASRGIRQRAWYYTTLTIDPSNADVVWFPQVAMLKTTDGGSSVRAVKGGGWDYHDVWIDPENTKRMVVASDAGVSLSSDGGETWARPPIPIAQFYHLSVDTNTPYRVLGSLQDFGTVSGPSNSLHSGGILSSDWHSVGGGEAGHVVADPSDPEIVWAGEYLGFISRYDGRTGQAPHMGIYPDDGSGHGAEDLRYRFQWTAPIVVSPHDPKTVYHAANILFKTEDGGQSWQAISPDLTRNDVTKQKWAGGPITGDNTGVEFYSTIFAVAESPVEKGLIWAGTDDGLVHLTRDGGASWSDVTPDGVPEWGTVSTIEASRWDAGVAYVVVNAHRLDDETPYLFKTTNYGRSWKSLTNGLDPEIYLHVVREDTRRKGMLYLGTERGVMVSRDDGANWTCLRLNMPTVAVVDLAVAGDDLVVGTLGRSAWILDDLTPVREMSSEIEATTEHLFAPLPAVRWRYASAPYGSSAGAGSNPPKGAIITYHLAEKPEGEVTLEVLDSEGALVRKLSGVLKTPYTSPDHPDWNPDSKPKPELSVTAGINRASWDLAYQEAKWVTDARFDTGAPRPGPTVLPGEYTLRLTVEGRSSTQPLRVEADSRSTASAADLEAQLAFALGVRQQLAKISSMIEKIRGLRKQVKDRNNRLASDPDVSELLALGEKLIEGLDAVEEKIHNPHAEVDYDVLGGRHGGAKMYSRLSWLFNTSGDHDGPPTQGMREVANLIEQELEAQEAALDELLSTELGELNALADELAVPYVMGPAND